MVTAALYNSILCVSGCYGFMCLVARGMCVLFLGLCWDSQWALLCPGVFYLEDCARTEPYVKNLSFQEFQTGKPASVIRCSIPQIVRLL